MLVKACTSKTTLNKSADWHSGLTLRQISNIERVQKVAVAVILSDYRTGKTDYTYDMALALMEIEPLEVRRDKLCLKFSKRTQVNILQERSLNF